MKTTIVQDQPSTSISGRRSIHAGSLPLSSAWLVKWFGWYGRRLLRKNFHLIRMSCDGPPPSVAGPMIIYLNHASWWDPMVALFLQSEFFAERRAFAPIDASALRRYPFFRKLGFFGVEQKTVRGGVQFLRTAERILQHSNSVLWLTPQGRFADVRERPVHFEAGIAHLAARLSNAHFVPLALEYTFWEERYPEVLVHFGKPIPAFLYLKPTQAQHSLEGQLEDVQDILSAKAKARRPADFNTLLGGSAGVGGIYDLWRGCRARWRGEKFKPAHGIL
ncbi:MAG: Acyltransferase [Verrucomicrobiales bacterium]|nr:Acyltransferase [Verrucomicrobiales bacterium]